MSQFKFSAGPWNVHSGADAYGPATRNEIDRFDYDFQKKCVENRDFEALEMYVMNLLMGEV